MKRTLLIIAIFVAALNLPRLIATHVIDIDYDPGVAGPVTLYATQWCGYCAKTRRFFERHDIPYTEYDVEDSSDAARELIAIGGFGVPVIVVGDQIIRGYQPYAIAAALELRNQESGP